MCEGCPIESGMTTLYLCHRQSEATNGRFSASENTTSLTSLPFGIGPSVPLFSDYVFSLVTAGESGYTTPPLYVSL